MSDDACSSLSSLLFTTYLLSLALQECKPWDLLRWKRMFEIDYSRTVPKYLEQKIDCVVIEDLFASDESHQHQSIQMVIATAGDPFSGWDHEIKPLIAKMIAWLTSYEFSCYFEAGCSWLWGFFPSRRRCDLQSVDLLSFLARPLQNLDSSVLTEIQRSARENVSWQAMMVFSVAFIPGSSIVGRMKSHSSVSQTSLPAPQTSLETMRAASSRTNKKKSNHL